VTTYFFPDNTVLCNFASVDSLGLLVTVLNGRGRWTSAVAYEASRSAQFMPTLNGIAVNGWLSEPIEITGEKDIQRVNQIRRAVFGGTDGEPLKHLGEAETCFLLKEHSEFAGSWWISDDQEAVRYGRFQHITTRETIDLMTIAVVNGDIAAHKAYELMLVMADKGRSLRLPSSPSELEG
jgi:hypothetical protein